MLLDYISIPIFVISFVLGLIFIYVLGPQAKTIFVYPSPENVNKILFKDNANNCFYYDEQEVTCPKDASAISTIPIQS